jgi:hypothetical protein
MGKERFDALMDAMAKGKPPTDAKQTPKQER